MQRNIYLVRHGQTYYNVLNKMQGWSNSPLTKQGYRDANQVAARLANIHFSAAVCSDLSRAIETTKIILKFNRAGSTKTPIISKYLRDGFYGAYEGTDIAKTWFLSGAPHGYSTFQEIVNHYSIAQARDWLAAADPFHLAEDNDQYWQRLDQGIQQIRNLKVPDNANVLWVSHGVTCLSLAERFGNGQYDVTKRPANGSISKMKMTSTDLKFIYYNQVP